MNRYFLLQTLFVLSLVLNSCQNKVDLIVHNATVYTLDENKWIASAFVVDKGRFVAVGGEELVEKYSAKKVLDLQELPVFPGFID